MNRNGNTPDHLMISFRQNYNKYEINSKKTFAIVKKWCITCNELTERLLSPENFHHFLKISKLNSQVSLSHQQLALCQLGRFQIARLQFVSYGFSLFCWQVCSDLSFLARLKSIKGTFSTFITKEKQLCLSKRVRFFKKQ